MNRRARLPSSRAFCPRPRPFAPTALANAAFQEWATWLPGVMLLVAITTVAVVHVRQQQSQPRVDRF